MQRILVVGNDSALLRTRVALFQSRWETLEASPGSLSRLLNTHIDLLVLCHSVNVTEAVTILETVKTVRSVPTLALETIGESRGHLPVTTTYDVSGGPASLLKKVEALLASP